MFMIFTYLFLDGLLNWLQNVVAFSLLHLGGDYLDLIFKGGFSGMFEFILGLFISYAIDLRCSQCLQTNRSDKFFAVHVAQSGDLYQRGRNGTCHFRCSLLQ